jgi:hypothetical protein
VLPAAGLFLMSASCGVRPAATEPAQSFSSTSTTTITTNAGTITNSNSTATTVAGVVVASPGCPVERRDQACHPRVLGGVRVEARRLPAGVTVTTRTAADGRYSLALAPGRYVLNVAVGRAFPRCPQVTVSVRSARPARADITCDSGIR